MLRCTCKSGTFRMEGSGSWRLGKPFFSDRQRQLATVRTLESGVQQAGRQARKHASDRMDTTRHETIEFRIVFSDSRQG